MCAGLCTNHPVLQAVHTSILYHVRDLFTHAILRSCRPCTTNKISCNKISRNKISCTHTHTHRRVHGQTRDVAAVVLRAERVARPLHLRALLLVRVAEGVVGHQHGELVVRPRPDLGLVEALVVLGVVVDEAGEGGAGGEEKEEEEEERREGEREGRDEERERGGRKGGRGKKGGEKRKGVSERE